MPWSVLTYMVTVSASFFAVAGYVRWFSRARSQDILTVVLRIAREESERLLRIRQEEEARKKREEKRWDI